MTSKQPGEFVYVPIDVVGERIEAAAHQAGYSTWIEWARSDDYEAAHEAMSAAMETPVELTEGEVFDDKKE